LARATADRVRRADDLELVMDPQLSVVLFRQIGWGALRDPAWSDEALTSGLNPLKPTVHDGETVFRCCSTNPTTTLDDVDAPLDAMR
jgi:glutamate/tyrosine decarboxylase-like PLP-dependent enzyme